MKKIFWGAIMAPIIWAPASLAQEAPLSVPAVSPASNQEAGELSSQGPGEVSSQAPAIVANTSDGANTPAVGDSAEAQTTTLAQTEGLESIVCMRGDQIRLFEVVRPGEIGRACDLKQTFVNSSAERTPYHANSDPTYCGRKALEMASNLEGKGFQCSLAATVEPTAEPTALGNGGRQANLAPVGVSSGTAAQANAPSGANTSIDNILQSAEARSKKSEAVTQKTAPKAKLAADTTQQPAPTAAVPAAAPTPLVPVNAPVINKPAPAKKTITPQVSSKPKFGAPTEPLAPKPNTAKPITTGSIAEPVKEQTAPIKTVSVKERAAKEASVGQEASVMREEASPKALSQPAIRSSVKTASLATTPPQTTSIVASINEGRLEDGVRGPTVKPTGHKRALSRASQSVNKNQPTEQRQSLKQAPKPIAQTQKQAQKIVSAKQVAPQKATPIANASLTRTPSPSDIEARQAALRASVNMRIAPDIIRSVLAAQTAAWNEGDLDAYMAGYWKSADLRLVSNGEIYIGWGKAKKHYLDNYGTGSALGDLDLFDMEIRMIDENIAVVVGRYDRQHPLRKEESQTGAFTRVMKRFNGHWRVVHDHTAAD